MEAMLVTIPPDASTVRVLHSVPTPLPLPDPEEWDADELHARHDGIMQQLRVLAEQVAEIASKPAPRSLVDETMLVVLAPDLLATLRVEKTLRARLRLAAEC